MGNAAAARWSAVAAEWAELSSETSGRSSQPRSIRQLQIVAVCPGELVFVEHARAVRDVLEAESARELVGR